MAAIELGLAPGLHNLRLPFCPRGGGGRSPPGSLWARGNAPPGRSQAAGPVIFPHLSPERLSPLYLSLAQAKKFSAPKSGQSGTTRELIGAQPCGARYPRAGPHITIRGQPAMPVFLYNRLPLRPGAQETKDVDSAPSSARGVLNPQFGLPRCSPLSQLKSALGGPEHPFGGRGQGQEVLSLFVFTQGAPTSSSSNKCRLQWSPPKASCSAPCRCGVTGQPSQDEHP